MSQATLFLNCTVENHIGQPFTGLHLTLICLTADYNAFEAYTDAAGQVWKWKQVRDGESSERAYWVPGAEGSRWRVFIDASAYLPPEHPVPSAVVDLDLSGSDNRDRSLAFVATPAGIMICNGLCAEPNQGRAPNVTTTPTPPLEIVPVASYSDELETQLLLPLEIGSPISTRNRSSFLQTILGHAAIFEQHLMDLFRDFN